MLVLSPETSAGNGIPMVSCSVLNTPDGRDLTDVIFMIALFEECPADFSFLRMQDTPPAGGDTLWVSGYEM